MCQRPTILILVLLTIFGLPAAVPSQIAPRSETEILAEREFEQAKNLYAETSRASNSASFASTDTGFRAALDGMMRAAELYRKLGARRQLAYCLAWIGKFHELLREKAKSIENYDAAIAIFDELGDRLEVGRQKANIGLVHYSAKDYNPALKAYKEALAEARGAKDTGLESLALSVIGQCYSALFDRPAAIKYWEEALKIAEASGDTSQQAWVLGLIAMANRESGDRQRAVDAYTKILNIYNKLSGNTALQLKGNTMVNIATLIAELGNERLSLDLKKGALLFYRMAGARHQEASIQEKIATGYSNLNEGENALQSLQDALTIYTELSDHVGESSVLGRISYVYVYNLDDAGKALPYAERSLAIARGLGNASSEAAALYRLASVYSHLPDRRNKGVECLNEAVRLYRSAKDFEKVADTLHELGTQHYFLEDYDAAVRNLNEALITYVEFGIPTSLPDTLRWLQYTWTAAGNPKLATAYGKQAVAASQQLRKNIRSLEAQLQRSYLKSVEENYRELIRLLQSQNRLLEAHQVLTMFKDEQSLDVIEAPENQKVVSPTYTPREKRFWNAYIEMFTQMQSVATEIKKLNEQTAGRKPTSDEAATLDRLGERRDATRKKLMDHLSSAPNGFAGPASDDDVVSQPAENTAIWKLVNDLSNEMHQETAVIYQLAYGDNIDFLIFSREDVKHVSVAAKGLNDKARTLWALLQSDKYDPRPAAKELYDLVFGPIEKSLPRGTKTLVWSLDGNLRYIPIGVLFDGKQYLVERYNNVSFTRADGDRMTRNISPKWTATAFGSSKAHVVDVRGDRVTFSSLPGVTAELETLFGDAKRPSVLQGEKLVDSLFTRAAMIEQLKAKRPVVHIASHFSFRPGDEVKSFLLLGDGTPFTLAEMRAQKDMFAGVELLTLSACNTAAQQADANGREVDAFFELAQRLGAQSVLATLWPVADNSTPWLMREFYRLKVAKNQNKGEALRNAQLSLLNGSARTRRSAVRTNASPVKIIVSDDPKRDGMSSRAETFAIAKKDAKPYVADRRRPFSHPYYWAPFVLIGNWR